MIEVFIGIKKILTGLMISYCLASPLWGSIKNAAVNLDGNESSYISIPNIAGLENSGLSFESWINVAVIRPGEPVLRGVTKGGNISQRRLHRLGGRGVADARHGRRSGCRHRRRSQSGRS